MGSYCMGKRHRVSVQWLKKSGVRIQYTRERKIGCGYNKMGMLKKYTSIYINRGSPIYRERKIGCGYNNGDAKKVYTDI
jgi:hypothetical protein